MGVFNAGKLERSSCGCGRSHEVPLKTVVIADSAVEELPGFLKNAGYGETLCVLCDRNTRAAAGDTLERILADAGFTVRLVVIGGDEHLTPDERAVGTALIGIPENCSALIAAGSGSITDVTRLLSLRLSIPFVSVPTAPSVDGYASSVAPITVDKIKRTFPAVLPSAIFADLDILSAAPEVMKAAGFGDLLGKLTARADWRLANFITGEYICEHVLSLVSEALEACAGALSEEGGYGRRAVSALIEGLVVTGLAIGMVGVSRPASGSEHHLSHFLEMKALKGEVPEYLHGEKVALGTYLITNLYHLVFSLSREEFASILRSRSVFDERVREERLRNAFGEVAGERIALRKGYYPDEAHRKATEERVLDQWTGLRSLCLDGLPSVEELSALMNRSRVKYRPSDFGFSRGVLEDALICAKEISYKYSLLYLLDELGVLEYFSGQLLARVMEDRSDG